MMQEMYVALSGALAAERSMATIANNIANVATAGYCADHVTVSGVLPPSDTAGIANDVDPKLGVPRATPGFVEVLYASLERDAVDLSPGVVRETSVKTDLMIEGDGFFVIDTPAGDRYTRQGAVHLRADGAMVTLDGMKLANASGGQIQIETADFKVAPDGTVTDGKGKDAGKLRIVTIPDKALLIKDGGARFRVDKEDFEPEEADPKAVKVRQGWLENSNVHIVDELISMIQVQRAYQSYQKLIQTSDSMTSQYISTLVSEG